jgi:hypothetical protein
MDDRAFTDDEAEARALTRKHLESVNRPPSAFVSLRPYCAQRSEDYPDLAARFGPGRAAEDDPAAVH